MHQVKKLESYYTKSALPLVMARMWYREKSQATSERSRGKLNVSVAEGSACDKSRFLHSKFSTLGLLNARMDQHQSS